MEGMTTGQKAGYILSYYKGKDHSCNHHTRCMHCPSCYNLQEKPSGCFILLYRQFTRASAVDTSFVDEYLDFYNLNGAYQIHNDLTVHLDKDTYLEEYSQNSSASVYTELPMLCFNGYYDIMIMDEKGLEYCAMQEIIYPLKTYLPADIYSQISDRICTADDNDGVTVPFAIDISDTDFAKGVKSRVRQSISWFPWKYRTKLHERQTDGQIYPAFRH